MASFNCFWYAWLVDYPVKPPMMVFWATYGILFAGGAFIAIFWPFFKARQIIVFCFTLFDFCKYNLQVSDTYLKR